MENEMVMMTGETQTFVLMFWVIWLVFYIFYGYCWMLLANKTKTENGWMAFVPILNVYLMLKIGGRKAWELIMFFVPLLNLIWIIVSLNSVAKRCGKGGLMTLGLVLLFPIMFPVLVFTYNPED